MIRVLVQHSSDDRLQPTKLKHTEKVSNVQDYTVACTYFNLQAMKLIWMLKNLHFSKINLTTEMYPESDICIVDDKCWKTSKQASFIVEAAVLLSLVMTELVFM